ncbi:MAG: RrF2 family transcriptional regulator [Gemmataceae bacterium]
MKITAQEEYGLRCLLRLAREDAGSSLTIPDIASAEGLSEPYVAKLLGVLRRARIIESVRGRSGGYRLAQAPSDIGLGSVLLELGEPLFNEPDYCERHSGTETDSCVHKGACSLRGLWNTLEHWIRHSLDQISIGDLLKNETHVTDLLRSRLANTTYEPPLELLTLTTIDR